MLRLPTTLTWLTGCLTLVLATASAETPNIIIVLADDLGWGDPQCYQADSRIPTPAIDRLAAEGARFTDAHTPSSVCTPTRYSLLTGRYAWRTRLKSGVLDGFDPPLISEEEDTVARLLKRAGYRTHCIGKWHLGLQWTDKEGQRVPDRDVSKGFRPGTNIDYAKGFTGGPIDLGFDSWFGISASLDMSPYCWVEDDQVVTLPEIESPEDKDGLFMNQVAGMTTEDFELEEVLPRIGERTAEIIRASENDETPFFCYVPLTSPHLPVVPTDASAGLSGAGAYGDFVVATDQALDAILEALDETGQAENTIVLFTSDNGGLFHWWDFRADDDGGAAPRTKRGEEIRGHGHQSNADWRGTKADIYEGGHRVPFLVRWPKGVKGGRVIEATVELTDVYATLAELVEGKGVGTSGMDSFSFLSLLRSESSHATRPFAVHHSLNGTFALRRGDWKLIEGRGSGGFTRPRSLPEGEGPDGQLYHLGEDPQETQNRYASEPGRVLTLLTLLNRIRETSATEAAKTTPLAASTTAKTASRPEGFEIDVIAAEPDIGQPIALTWDHQGRLWIAECHTYADRSKNYDLTESDRILVLEDRDANGTFETRTVFQDGLQRLTGLAVGHGGVWALTSPHLVFLPDADADLVPDGPAQIKLDGFDLNYTRHTIVNGLKWGPDGWLYARHGIVATSEIGTPGTPPNDRLRMNTGVWRYDPDSERCEAWTRGGTNPWGHDWNAEGDLFYINTVIGHFWHGIPGAYTKRMFGQHERPYLYRLVGMHADHWHFDVNGSWTDTRKNTNAEDAFGGGHAHAGLMVYQANKWPRRYRGKVYALNFHGRRINQEKLVRAGSGYVAQHEPDLVTFPDPWFRGIDLAQGPDGDVYVLDWSDTGECHDHDGIDRNSGRIYRIRYGEVTSAPVTPPDDFTTLESWLRHPNVWYARQARLLINEKHRSGQLSSEWLESLRSVAESEPDPVLALRYRDALQGAAAWSPSDDLDDPREALRVRALHRLRDIKSTPHSLPENRSALLEIATSDSTRVRLALAALLPRLPQAEQTPLAAALLRHGEDASDPSYPLLLWYAIEPLVAGTDPQVLHSLQDACEIRELRRLIIRRLAEDYDKAEHRALLTHLILRQPSHLEPHLRGLADALEGLPQAEALPRWNAIAALQPELPLINELGAVFGDGRSLESLLAIAEDRQAKPEARRRAVEALGSSDLPDLKKRLMTWVDDDQLTGVAVTALARFPGPDVGTKLVGRFAYLKPEERSSTIQTLISRPDWAGILLDRIASKRLGPDAISTAQARQIAQHGDTELTDKLTRIWGEVNLEAEDPAAKAMEARLRDLASRQALAEADPSHGRALYAARCASCHQLYGDGGSLGPDLTGSGRHDLDYVIENVLYPNAVVPAGYQLSVLELKDGRSLSGVIVAESPKRLTLSLPGATQPIHLTPNEVAARKTLPQSLMPPGLLNDLDDQALLDFLSYVMGDHQAPLPEK